MTTTTSVRLGELRGTKSKTHDGAILKFIDQLKGDAIKC
tara:strand:- start:6174 stop:6290 length:117 start_codon:yes stop_codon:yes gene_type:complete